MDQEARYNFPCDTINSPPPPLEKKNISVFHKNSRNFPSLVLDIFLRDFVHFCRIEVEFVDKLETTFCPFSCIFCQVFSCRVIDRSGQSGLFFFRFFSVDRHHNSARQEAGLGKAVEQMSTGDKER